MFKKLGKVLAKAAIWCLGHPDELVAIGTAVKDASKKENK